MKMKKKLSETIALTLAVSMLISQGAWAGEDSYGGVIDVGEEAAPEGDVDSARESMLLPASGYSLYNSESLEKVGASATDSVYDPRIGHANEDSNLLSKFRNQGYYNLCWAFQTIANCEASYNKNNGTTGQAAYDADNDFSERQIAYYTYYDSSSVSDPLGYTKGDSNLIKSSSDGTALSLEQAFGGSIGGTIVLTEETLGKGIGPVREKYAPYEALMSPLDSAIKYGRNVARLKNSAVFPEKQKSFMKEMILKYGAVGVNFYASSGYFTKNGDDYYYNYKDTDNRVNHGVSIVGWDDTVSANTFSVAATQDGAYLCKNSSLSKYEYFWMSYDCMEYTRNAYALDVRAVNENENIYEYDGSLWSVESDGDNVNDSDIKASTTFANIFKAKCGGTNKTEYITDVIVRFDTVDDDYSIQIYKNPGKKSPESGTKLLKTPVTGTVTNAGYTDISLGDMIPLKNGDTFSVVVTKTKPGIYLSCDKKVGLTSAAYLDCNENVSTGCSFYKTSDGTWKDFAKVDENDYTARIKAVTETIDGCVIDVSKPGKVTKSKTYPGKTVSLNLSDKSVGEAVWSSSDTSVATVDSKGVVTAKWKGKAVITAQVNGNTYRHKITVLKPSFEKKKSSKIYPGNSYVKSVANVYGDVTVSWNSADASIASVDEATGEVYARKSGKTYIYAYFDGNRDHYIRYKINIAKFALNKKKLTFNLTKNGSEYVTLSVKNSQKYGLTPTWSSSDKSVASVDSEGMVTSLGVGSAYISAKIADQVVSCNVIVR